MTRWVQHMSKQGEKWQIFGDDPLIWHAYDRGVPLSLPKSEYRECAPPEGWTDVTKQLEVSQEGRRAYYTNDSLYYVEVGPKHRLRKVQLMQPDGPSAGQMHWAFIIERREP